MSEGHSHHHRQRQSDAGLHLGLTTDEVALEAKAVVDAVVDPLQGTASVVRDVEKINLHRSTQNC